MGRYKWLFLMLLVIGLVGCGRPQSQSVEKADLETTNENNKNEFKDLVGYWSNTEDGGFLLIEQKENDLLINDLEMDLVYLLKGQHSNGRVYNFLVTNEMTEDETMDPPYKARLILERDSLVIEQKEQSQQYNRNTSEFKEPPTNEITNKPLIEEKLVRKASNHLIDINLPYTLMLYSSTWKEISDKTYYVMDFRDSNKVTTIYGDSEGVIYMSINETLIPVEEKDEIGYKQPEYPLDVWVLSKEFKTTLEKGIMPGSVVQLGSTIEDMRNLLGFPQESNEFEGEEYHFYEHYFYQYEVGGEEVKSLGWHYSERLHLEVKHLLNNWGSPDRIEQDMFQGGMSNNYIYELNDMYLITIITAGINDESPIITVSYSKK